MTARASEREPKQAMVAALTRSLELRVAPLLLFVLFDLVFMVLMKAVCETQESQNLKS